MEENKAAAFILCQSMFVEVAKLKRAYKKDRSRVKIRVCSNGTSGNGFRLKEGRLGLGLRKFFLL